MTAAEVQHLRPPPSPRPAGDVEIEHPARLLRIATTVQSTLQEMRETRLDRTTRRRLVTTHDEAVRELGDLLPDALRDELAALTMPLHDARRTPSAAELRVAHAQLVGWLEGLLSGIQATIVSEHMARMHEGGEPRRTRTESTSGSAGTYL